MQRSVLRVLVAVPAAAAAALWSVQLSAPAPLSASAPVVEQASTPATGGPGGSERIEVPDVEVELPASTSAPERLPSATDGRFSAVSARSSAGDIPAVALAAYQRAESLIGSVDARCGLSWQLIAAIARIESDHGRYDGAAVGEDGVSRPAIIGPALDGDRGTARILDTDAGELDGDAVLDRAVGPLQFIPSTWAVVGVDGDADGTRDPQDVDDAALAAAVYLCSGDDDLGGREGLRAALYRYNHSTAYVDAVVAVMEGYLAGTDVLPLVTTARAGSLVPVALVPLAQLGGKGPGRGGREADTTSLREPRGASLQESGSVLEQSGPRDQPPAEPTLEPAPEPTESAEPAPTDPLPTDPTEPAPTDPVPTDAPTDAPTEPAPTEEPADGAVDDCTAEDEGAAPEDGDAAPEDGAVTEPGSEDDACGDADEPSEPGPDGAPEPDAPAAVRDDAAARPAR